MVPTPDSLMDGGDGAADLEGLTAAFSLLLPPQQPAMPAGPDPASDRPLQELLASRDAWSMSRWHFLQRANDCCMPAACQNTN